MQFGKSYAFLNNNVGRLHVATPTPQPLLMGSHLNDDRDLILSGVGYADGNIVPAAQATVSVRMREAGKIVTAQSSDTDTVVASCRAYVHALNKLLVRREKTKPAGIVAV